MNIHLKTCIATLLLLLPALFSCTGTGSDKSAEASGDAASVTMPDSLDTYQSIVWRSAHSLPVTRADIDSIISYFNQADVWTGKHIGEVKTETDFNRLDSLLTVTFPALDQLSFVIEQNASLLNEADMERLQQIAVSIGEKVDSAARVAGIDPSSVNPSHSTE